MIIEIISIGTELLMGQVLNTNARFIAEYAACYGYRCLYQDTVGDNPERLKQVVEMALSRADILILSGGLGPTKDDLTKETVAACFGMTCEPNEAEIRRLTAYFEEKGREMTPNNLKQACFPREAIILPNPKGTAPGCILEKDGKAAILMPGPPREMEPMFLYSVLPYLEKRTNVKLYSKELRFFGIGESKLCFELRDLIENQTNPTIASYAKTGECTVRLTAKCVDESEGAALLEPMLNTIRSRIGDRLYSENGEPLNFLCARLLRDNHKTLALAESCTGGLLASNFIEIPGSSAFLVESAVTYSNEAKIRRLGVSPETLAIEGAVSKACALEMAEGIRETSGADIALATTGFAGPDGGNEKTPVGTVFIAISDVSGSHSVELHLNGDRNRVRESASLNALDLLRRKCLNLPLNSVIL